MISLSAYPPTDSPSLSFSHTLMSLHPHTIPPKLITSLTYTHTHTHTHTHPVGESDRVRDLYSRLLKRTSHVKVWLSFAQYEAAEAKALLGAADESTAEQNAGMNSECAFVVL